MRDVSVIVICKDAADTIGRALDSIRRQSVTPSEVMAVVSGPEDRTLEILAPRVDVQIIQQTGTGIADARNLGISLSKGGHIAFLDADDEWTPDAMEIQLAALDSDPAAMMAMGRLVKMDVGEESAGLPEPAVTPGGCVFRREAFSHIGAFSPQAAVACDHEWFHRARLEGIRIATHEGLVLRKHIHGENTSIRRRELYRREIFSMLKGRS